MPLTIRTYLANRDCQFTGRTIRPEGSFDENVAAAHLPTDHVARAHILQNGRARIMVVVPANRQLDSEALGTLLRRPFIPCSRRELAEVVPECDPEAIPPVGEPYGLSVILDRNLIGLDRIYFAAGVTDLFVCMSGSEFARLHAHSLRKLQISLPLSEVAAVEELLDLQPEDATDELLTPTLSDDLQLERMLEESAGLDIADVIKQEESTTKIESTEGGEEESLSTEIEMLTGLSSTAGNAPQTESTDGLEPDTDTAAEDASSESLPEEIEIADELASADDSWEISAESTDDSTDEIAVEAPLQSEYTTESTTIDESWEFPDEVALSSDSDPDKAVINAAAGDEAVIASQTEALEQPVELFAPDDDWEISDDIPDDPLQAESDESLAAVSGEHIVEDLPEFDDSILELSAAATTEVDSESEPVLQLEPADAPEEEIPLLSEPVVAEFDEVAIDGAAIPVLDDEFPLVEDIVEPAFAEENPVAWESDTATSDEAAGAPPTSESSEEFNLEDTLTGEPLSMEMRVEQTPPDPEIVKRNKLRRQLRALRERIRAKIETASELPAMPGIAGEIISLRNNAYSTPVELAAVIEQDPALSAQLVRYATSSLYAYQGKVDTVETAIVRVLGVDFVFNLALGLSLGRTFDNPKDGPIGLDAFWQHAVRTATLSQSLCNSVPIAFRPSPGSAYLAGLIHNFGFLLLGHYFPREFSQLNQLIAKFPERSIPDIEARTIGLTHCELGAWLMKAWKMPKEIIAVVQHHHDAAYEGDYADYVALTFIANTLLKQHGIGDSETIQIPEHLLKRLHLTAEAADAALAGVMEAEEGLDFIAHRMTP